MCLHCIKEENITFHLIYRTFKSLDKQQRYYSFTKSAPNHRSLTLMKKNVPVHVAKLREPAKFALYQVGTERRTLCPTACSQCDKDINKSQADQVRWC